MSIKTFKRVEKKFMLNQSQLDYLLEHIPTYMSADKFSQNGEVYSIYNIYYDTDNNDIIRKSIQKPYFKEKLRLRSYKLATTDDEKVFLELKKKIGGVVSKRRAKLTIAQAKNFVELGIVPQTKGYLNKQVINEISEFLSHNKVNPKVYISYDRLAFFGKDDDSFRVTFDSNIQTRRNNVSFTAGSFGKPLLSQNQYLMEIKINGSIPIWLTKILSEQQIYSSGFSKYGTEYKQYCTSKTVGVLTPTANVFHKRATTAAPA